MSSPTHAPHHPPEKQGQRSRLVPIRFFSVRSTTPPPPPQHDQPPKKHHDDDDEGDTRPAPIFGARYRGGNRRKPQTLRKTVNEDFHIVLIASGILCFNAGYINVVTMNSYLQTTTSHVTGLVAKTGLLMGDGQWEKVYLPATTWAAFLFGAFLAGILITYQSFYLGRGYGRALLLISLIQGVAVVVGVSHEESPWVHHHYIYACAVGCGLQNGLTTKYSGNVVRTTHLTGATTDLGVVLGHIAKGKLNEVWKAQLHGTAVVFFLIGGICGTRAFKEWREYALILNVALTGTLGMAHIIWLSWHEHKHVMDVWASTADIPVHKPISRNNSDSSLESRDKRFQHGLPHGHHSWTSSHMDSVPEVERESSDGDIIPIPRDSDDDALSDISENDVALEAEQEKVDNGHEGIFGMGGEEGDRKEEKEEEIHSGANTTRGGHVEMASAPYGRTHPHTRV